MKSFVLRRFQWWWSSPMTHINARGPAFIHPRSWPRWVWSARIVAPALVPTKAGDRVKTDRRGAEKLARCHRAGDLTAVWVPDEAHEALRDLIRAREAAKADQQRARQRLGKFLLRQGKRPASKTLRGRPSTWSGSSETSILSNQH